MTQRSVAESDALGTGGSCFHFLGRGRVERKAIHLPSGDTTGARASGSPGSIGRALSFEPSTIQSELRSSLVLASIQLRM
jgi:hypothetical protein